MPENLREVMHNAPPLAVFGMMVGQADLMYQQIPALFKATVFLIGATLAYADIKSDIRLLTHQVNEVVADAMLFDEFMHQGDRCTATDCAKIDTRVQSLEKLHMERFMMNLNGKQ